MLTGSVHKYELVVGFGERHSGFGVTSNDFNSVDFLQFVIVAKLDVVKHKSPENKLSSLRDKKAEKPWKKVSLRDKDKNPEKKLSLTDHS